MSAGAWKVRDTGKDEPRIREVENRSEAEETKSDMVSLGATPENIEILPPGEGDEATPDGGTESIKPEVVDHSEENSQDETPDLDGDEPVMGVDICVHCEREIEDGLCPDCDDRLNEERDSDGYDLPDQPRIDESPLTWMPDEFSDPIEGTEVINRQGYKVMAHHYGIETESECVVGPEETDHEFCRHKATATTDDGKEYQAHASASTDRGDDSHLLTSLSDTRARKRALAQATGVGMVAIEELKNGFEQEHR